MRLLTHNRHDYYDTVMGYGFDPKIIYDRFHFKWHNGNHYSYNDHPFLSLEKIMDVIKTLPHFRFYPFTIYKRRLNIYFLLFCGKLHLLYTEEKINHSIETFPTEYTWDKEEVLVKVKDFLKDSWELKERWAEFNNLLQNNKDYTEVHRILGSPVILYQSYYKEWGKKVEVRYIELNPLLLPLEFGKVMDAFQCHQTIAQFMGNNMVVQRDPNPFIPNDIKVESKGMDPKRSFRPKMKD